MKKIIFWATLFLFIISCNNDEKSEATPNTATAGAASNNEKKPPVEIIDSSYADQFKKAFTAFENLDATGFTAFYADDARFYFSSGDSIIGRQAIQDYYAGRIKLMEYIRFPEKIFLAINANEKPSSSVSGGKWVMVWSRTEVKYKNGKSISFWVHNDYHLNDAGKVDFSTQYIDRQPIKAASE